MIVCAAILGLATSCAAPAETRDHVAQTHACPSSPALTAYAITYDPDRGQVVLFGGATSTDLSAALWAWDGTTWHCIVPDGPPPRTDAVLAYDVRRHVLVLYGGRAGRAPLEDTWELSATGWTMKSNKGPTPEPHAAMAYDDASGGVLLFAGMGDDGQARMTWRWDGTAWTKVAEGLNGEFPDGMLAGTSSIPALLVTARRTSKPDAFDPPLYEWRGGGWQPLSTRGALPTFSPQAPTARIARGALLYAGFEPDTSVSTWILEENAWRRDMGPQPPRRRGAHMVFDDRRGVVVLHAGYDGTNVLDDTWEWNGTWRRAAGSPGSRGTQNR